MSFVAPESLDHLAALRIVIVGAGPTGLGAASRLHELGLRNFLVLERGARAGGLAASFQDEAGFTWDVGGHVQFSHYEYFDRAMDRAMGDEWCLHQRESWIWIRDRFIPYPFQNNTHLLPDADKRACLLGLLRRPHDAPAATDFAKWVRARFGDGIAETFLLPYNAKVWAFPPETLSTSWVSERVAQVDLERVVLNLLDNRPDAGWGPNNRFRFPAAGGTGEIWRRVAAALPAGSVEYGAEVAGIDAAARVLRLADGSSRPYDLLISTMPLDELARLSGRALPGGTLRHSTVHVFGIGLEGQPPPDMARKCWVYYPEANCPFYRLTVFSNYSPRNVPDAGRYWSVMVEVSESSHKTVDHGRLFDEVVDGLIATRVITAAEPIVSRWQYTAAHGYPTPFLGRDLVVDPLIDGFERDGIFTRGRFGAWKYEVSNQDHSYMQGVELVNRFAFGDEEVTLRRPDVVNAPR